MHIDNADAAIVGIILAIVVSLFARFVGLDKDRAFYPTVLVVIAVLYDLFAVLGDSWPALQAELVGTSLFLFVVVVGFRRNLWIVAAGMAGHGLYDFVHPMIIVNPGVPAWWPAFCGAYDVMAGVAMGWLLSRKGIEAKP
jgi:hypothetical protein